MLLFAFLFSTLTIVNCQYVYNASKDVKYLLYTQQNKVSPQFIWPNDTSSVSNSNFNVTKKTCFMVHGWTENAGLWNYAKDSMLRTRDYNVILVDWSNGSTGDYLPARNRVYETGVALGDFIKILGLNLANVILAGFSLGAHIVGCTGKTNPGIGSCLYLDAAGPNFNISSPDCAGPNDCIITEALHTCAGFLGINANIAQNDFWANGGSYQPSCFPFDVYCYHIRSRVLYNYTLSGYNMIGRKCPNPSNITAASCTGSTRALSGEPVNSTPSGTPPNVYYLPTSSSPPYGTK